MTLHDLEIPVFKSQVLPLKSSFWQSWPDVKYQPISAPGNRPESKICFLLSPCPLKSAFPGNHEKMSDMFHTFVLNLDCGVRTFFGGERISPSARAGGYGEK